MYDRHSEDLGNIVDFGHLNVTVTDQRLATAFFVSGLGLTRDPYLNTGTDLMWVNVGRSQFHLPTAANAQRVRGTIGIVTPDLDLLEARLAKVAPQLIGTAFDVHRCSNSIEVVCPWGNKLRCHEPDSARFGGILLGIPYIEFNVPRDSAQGIGRFYSSVFGALTDVTEDAGEASVRVSVGNRQHFSFRETSDVAPYDKHHVQVYVANFSGPYERLRALDLITQESSQHQYRFCEIVDPDGNVPLYTLEHEVRSATHPLFARELCNRNLALTNAYYVSGYEEQPWLAP